MTKKKAIIETYTQPIIIHQQDLPLCCPPPGTPVWNLHPKVYLPFGESHEVECPYCSAHYVLAGLV